MVIETGLFQSKPDSLHGSDRQDATNPSLRAMDGVRSAIASKVGAAATTGEPDEG